LQQTLEPGVKWDKKFRGNGRKGWSSIQLIARNTGLCIWVSGLLLFSLAGAAIPLQAREKDNLKYGEGLVVNVPLPEPEVARVVEEVAKNTIIRGTKEYNKDEYLAGAVAATATPVFPPWTEGGKVFYKVRSQALDPRNFKNSGDLGTVAVRYVVQPQGEGNTVLRIDAAFVEDSRHGVHPSNGSVESSEYKDIQNRLQAVELVQKETEEALREKQERQAKQNFGLGSDTAILGTPPAVAKSDETPASTSLAPPLAPRSSDVPQATAYDQPESLKQHVAELHRQVERLVKKPGAPLKSAPFHTASTLRSLEPGAEVLILITTPYWYGVETHEGEHGWLRRDEVESLP
jgi:hypothetical protein